MNKSIKNVFRRALGVFPTLLRAETEVLKGRDST